ncbi:hypothetical protein [Legionella sainthelensi]|uniref:hypothetical protein n=1 Tax=Legionella sainthelensi TaxID=28087 RepID=UPI000E209F72|nr:hypothetical protein [Legionella sainthelensi]
MTEFFAQQCYFSTHGIDGGGVVLKKNNLDAVNEAVKNYPTHIYPWLIFKSANEGNKITPLMYVNINESKWIDL